MAVMTEKFDLPSSFTSDLELASIPSPNTSRSKLETISEPVSSSSTQVVSNAPSQTTASRRPSRAPTRVGSRVPSRLPSRTGSPTPDANSTTERSLTDASEKGDRPAGTVDMMAHWLFLQQRNAEWFRDMNPAPQGVLLKNGWDKYISMPSDLIDTPLGYNCAIMNVRCAMTITSRAVETYLSIHPHSTTIPLADGGQLQMLGTLDDLPNARRYHYAAYIRSEGYLLVWGEDPMTLPTKASEIEQGLMRMLWTGGANDSQDFEKEAMKKVDVTVEAVDIDTAETQTVQPRQRNLQHACMISIVLGLCVVIVGLSLRTLVHETAIDHTYTRFALCAILPIIIFFSMFFVQILVSSIAQLIGPVKQCHANSKFYSGVKSPRIRGNLPHVTIQCPVYKEGLEGVIRPTIQSLKAAISTYELQGGTANIFINDDGLQLIPDEDRDRRIEFYADEDIGWTARPKHGVDGFIRKGRFKKASNMNYGLNLSLKLEEKLGLVTRHAQWTQADEDQEYNRCLLEVSEENPRAWMEGNLRIGDYVVLIDSDTRVPVDCLLDAVSEMEHCPEVAIIQFSSGVMQVVHNYFENGITFFTNLIYTAIRYGSSCGDVAPFVGHNAILRWSAIQEVAFVDADEPEVEKFWSESHVSEDFDMSLRLQILGYTVRLGAWAGDGFKEGVSLTVYDELMRWEKYAYGCSELVFHPIRTWLWRGPFTPLFRKFIGSNMPFPSKVTLIAYIGTYYAIGSAWLLTTINYFVMGWFGVYGYLDNYYLNSWQVWISILVVFNGLGIGALAVYRYRTGANSLLGALFENIKYSFMLFFFFSGISLHVSQALLAHMFEINMNWGATAKEAEFSNFFLEVPKILAKFRLSMIFGVLGVAGMVVLSGVVHQVPPDWRIVDAVAIVPAAVMLGGHLLLPIVLNPALMTFTW